MGSEFINLPRQTLPFSQKNKKWRKACLDWADSKTFFNYSLVRKSVVHKKINYDLLNGKLHMTDMELIINPNNIQAGYMLRSLWSFDLRYTYLKPDEYSYMNNNLYFNRHNFYDFSVSKYLTRNYAAKIQLTVGLARSNGENRTPDSTYTYNGNEWIGNLLFQFKF